MASRRQLALGGRALSWGLEQVWEVRGGGSAALRRHAHSNHAPQLPSSPAPQLPLDLRHACSPRLQPPVAHDEVCLLEARLLLLAARAAL
eukprot:3202666-Rhodomonas_salina.1